MEYYKKITMKNGQEALLRNGTAADAAAVLDCFLRTHAETDFLLSYPDEVTFTIEQEADFLQSRSDSPDAIEIVAEVDGKIVGTAGIGPAGSCYKVKHRAGFGISVLKDYWGCGLGRALTDACIECARKAGYTQLELDVSGDNAKAIAMYESAGFREFGRNPKGFRSRESGFKELISMFLEL